MTRKKEYTWAPDPWPSMATQDPVIRLAAAVLLQACEEAKAGCPDALRWFSSDEGEIFCRALGFDHRAAMRFANSCPPSELAPLWEVGFSQFWTQARKARRGAAVKV
jgi:hypothetical protein